MKKLGSSYNQYGRHNGLVMANNGAQDGRRQRATICLTKGHIRGLTSPECDTSPREPPSQDVSIISAGCPTLGPPPTSPSPLIAMNRPLSRARTTLWLPAALWLADIEFLLAL